MCLHSSRDAKFRVTRYGKYTLIAISGKKNKSSLKANSSSVIQKNRRILCNANINLFFDKRLPLIHIWNEINSVYIVQAYFLKIYISSGFLHQNSVNLLDPELFFF